MEDLVAMGFDEAQVREAWTHCGGNAERAVEYLLSGGSGGGGSPDGFAASSLSSTGNRSTSTSNDGTTKMISCDLSQYSVDQGRSACTCIALTGASLFLQQQEFEPPTPDLLRQMILQGVETYQSLNAQNSSSVEHMSAEQVLLQQSDVLPEPLQRLTLSNGGIRQGLLTNEPNSHPLGLRTLLEACSRDADQETEPAASSSNSSSYMAVLLTKTPETVVVLLPRSNRQQQQTLPSLFVLLDSHPRPHVFGPAAEHAYARCHDSLQELVHSLTAIFPPTELGPDVPELMAMMYNSFDLYPLLYRK